MLRISFVFIGLVCFASVGHGGFVTTTFSSSEFSTGSFAPVTLLSGDGTLSATFSGGVQRQSFDGPSYNDGPDAYFFINGTFTGSFGDTQSGSTDIGRVVFNRGVESVSFFAADRANGQPSFRVLSTTGNELTSQLITATTNRPSGGATAINLDSATLGSLIGSIEFDNAGPAGNPPYVIAIDSFSATAAAVPEPSGALPLLFLALGTVFRRRR